jgi:predicted negative regulator of RcsB-dependent stress response
VINLLLGLGAALAVIALTKLLGMPLWVGIPMGTLAGGGLFIWQGRKIQQELEQIFTRAGDHLKKQQFEKAIETMKEGYRFSSRQFLVKGSIDGQLGVVQYLRKKNEEAEPLLASASMQHYIAKAMLGILQWKRGEKKKARKTFDLALKSGKKESLLYAVYAYVLVEMGERDKAIAILNQGLGICKGDERLITNRNQLQNGKALKMKLYGEQWYQFLLERPMIRQEAPPFARVSRRAIRG